jgi:hypothetical protein
VALGVGEDEINKLKRWERVRRIATIRKPPAPERKLKKSGSGNSGGAGSKGAGSKGAGSKGAGSKGAGSKGAGSKGARADANSDPTAPLKTAVIASVHGASTQAAVAGGGSALPLPMCWGLSPKLIFSRKQPAWEVKDVPEK